MTRRAEKGILIGLIAILCFALCGVLLACIPDSPAASYTVSFDTNGGTPIASVKLKANSTLELPEAPTKQSYVFYGWYYDAECTRKFNPNQFRVIADTTLYAHWIDANIYRHPITVGEMQHGTVKVLNDITEAVKGDILELRVYPEAGYRLREGSLCVNEIPISGTKFTMIPESVKITAEFELCPYRVQIYADNGWVYTDKETYTAYETVNFTVVPQLGYYLNRMMLGSEILDRDVTSFPMPTHDALLSLEFLPIDYNTQFSIQLEESDGGTVEADANFASAGEWVTVEAFPNDEFYLAKLEINGVTVSGLSFCMPKEDVVVKGKFAPVKSHNSREIRVKDSVGGIIECPFSAAVGSNVMVSVVEIESGYVFLGLLVNGNYVYGMDFIMPDTSAHSEIQAIFVKKPYKVSGVNLLGGWLKFSRDTAYAGTMVTVVPISADGYYFRPDSLTLNGTPIDGLRFIMPDEDVEISGTFLNENGMGGEEFPITVVESEGGTLYIDKKTGCFGEKITVTVYPEVGYRYVVGTLTFNGAPIGVDGVFSMRNGEAFVYAEFERYYQIESIESVYGYAVPSTATAAKGETISLSIYAKDPYDAIGVSVYVNGQIQPNPYGFEMPDEDVTITLEMSRIDTSKVYTIAAESTEGGKLTVPESAYVGQRIGVEGIADSNYYFEKLERKNEKGEWELHPLSFYMPAENITLRAVFSSVSEDEGSFISNAYRIQKEFITYFGIDTTDIYISAEEIYTVANRVGCSDATPYIEALFESVTPFDWVAIRFKSIRNCRFYAELFEKYYLSQWSFGQAKLYEDGTLIVCSYDDPSELHDAFRLGVFQWERGIYYRRSDGSVGVWEYNTTSEHVEIPMTANGVPVRRLAPFALEKNNRQTTHLYLGALTEIAAYAASGLPLLKTVFLGNVKSISGRAFWNSLQLEEWILPANQPYLSISNGVIYTKDFQTAIRSVNSFQTNKLVLDSRCRTIGDAAFAQSTLTSMDLVYVDTIGDYAFSDCRDLMDLKEKNIAGVKKIGNYAFQNTSVTEWKWREAFTIGVNAFPLHKAETVSVTVLSNTYFEVRGKNIFDGNVSPDNLTVYFQNVNVLNQFAKANDTSVLSPCFEILPNASDITGTRSSIIFHPEGGVHIDSVVSYLNTLNQLPAPIRDGYAFVGWYFERECISAAPDILTLEKSLYHLWAKWKKL